MPGRTSLTVIPYPLSRSANSLVIIDTPALEIQYSPLLVELVYADMEEIKWKLRKLMLVHMALWLKMTK